MYVGPNVGIVLVIVIGVVGAIAVVLFLAFIVTLCCCIRSSRRKQGGFSLDRDDSGPISLPEKQFSPTIHSNGECSTNFNQSYGQFAENDTGLNRNNYTKPNEVYEEIKASRSAITKMSTGHGYSENPRPPASLPNPLSPLPDPPAPLPNTSSTGIYVDPDEERMNNSQKIGVVNPSYGGKVQRESSTTTEDYLIVTDKYI